MLLKNNSEIKITRRLQVMILTVLMIVSMIVSAGCSQSGNEGTGAGSEPAAEEGSSSGDIVVLFTSDVHCGAGIGQIA